MDMNGGSQKERRFTDPPQRLEPCTGRYVPGAQPMARYWLATKDPRLQAIRNVAMHGDMHSETSLVALPSHLLGTLILYPGIRPVVWAMWLPDSWFNELSYLTRAALEVVNLPATEGRSATTSFLIAGRTSIIEGETSCPPQLRSRAHPVSPLVLVFACQGIAHVVHYSPDPAVDQEIEVATHAGTP